MDPSIVLCPTRNFGPFLIDPGCCTAQVSYTLQVNIETACPDDVVSMALEKCQSRSVPMDKRENYVLRVSGRDEYFLGSYPLAQFKVSLTYLLTCHLHTYLGC